MMSLTFDELQKMKLLMETDRDAFRASIDYHFDQADTSDIPSYTADPRTFGVFLGTGIELPSFTRVGSEVQILLAYDNQTDEVGIYLYTGITAGVSISLPDLPNIPVSGVFVFDGPLNQMSGLSGGAAVSAGASVGYSRSPSGFQMVQVGQQVDLSADLVAGWTWQIWKEQPDIDWDLTQARVLTLFADDPVKREKILAEIAVHKGVWHGGINDDFVEKFGFLAVIDESCFLAGTMIDIWPVETDLSLGPDGTYDERLLLENVVRKPIEQIETGDIVVSFDKRGARVPARVSRTFRNSAKIVLDFFGTSVTPGHVFYRHDSRRASSFETLIDILCDDGIIETAEGVLIRASTGVEFGDDQDRLVQVVTGVESETGVSVIEHGRLRLGTRFITDDGQDLCINDLVAACGATLTEDGLLQIGVHDPAPLHWSFDHNLPRPESYVLARSGTTLEQIFRAAEWDPQRPWMQAPLGSESGPIVPARGVEHTMLAPNRHLKDSDQGYAPNDRTLLTRTIRNTSIQTV